MNKGSAKIDLVKLGLYLLKRVWIIIICAAIGFAAMYIRAKSNYVETYTARGTLYVQNGNPNLYNYGYTSSSDLNSAAMLVGTYKVIITSDQVMDRVAERLVSSYSDSYSGITNSQIAGSLSMSSVSDTSVMRISCTTLDPQRSADICNAVLDVAPESLEKIVGGTANRMDFAEVPKYPNSANFTRSALTGALMGGVLAAAVLTLLHLLNRRITDVKDLTDNYTPPVLSTVKRDKRENDDPGAFLLSSKSAMDITESYSKLRMNLFYTLVDKERRAVAVTSAISGEGKSTITANLAISCAMSGKKVLLIDADMRRACQRDIFHYKRKSLGLSNVLVGECGWRDTIINAKQHEELDIMPAGHQPPNPAELLDSKHMRELMKELEKHYDLILLDAPPINIVSDPLALSHIVAGSLFVVRQNFTDHGEIKKALNACELTGLSVLGFVFYGEKISSGSYYSRRYYKGYYHKYSTSQATQSQKDSKGSKESKSRESKSSNAKETARRGDANENTEKNGAGNTSGIADGTDGDSNG